MQLKAQYNFTNYWSIIFQFCIFSRRDYSTALLGHAVYLFFSIRAIVLHTVR